MTFSEFIKDWKNAMAILVALVTIGALYGLQPEKIATNSDFKLLYKEVQQNTKNIKEIKEGVAKTDKQIEGIKDKVNDLDTRTKVTNTEIKAMRREQEINNSNITKTLDRVLKVLDR